MPYASTYDDPTMDPMSATRGRRVGTPPVPPTLSKLGQLLERERAARANAPLESTPIPEGLIDATPAMRQPQPLPYPGVQSPEEMARTTRGYKTFGQTPGTAPADKLGLLREAPLGSKVERGASGNFEVGAPKKPSRLMKALEGAVSMAAMAGASGPTEGSAMRMLGGAGVGAAGGAIKPRLVEKFQRENELAQLRGEIGEDQGIAYKDAQITAARAQPELRELQVKNTINESLLREQDRRADNRRADTAIAETKRATDERIRHNKALESKPGAARPTRTLNGQFWEEDEQGVMRVKKGSPPPPAPKPAASTAAADERRAVRSEKKAAAGREAAALYKKGSDYWDQAQAKRKEAEGLAGKKFQTDAEKATIARLNREAEGLEKQTREVQIKGDGLAAESEGADEAPQSSSPRKSFNLGAWKRDHPNATPAEVEAKRKQYSTYRIVE